MALSTDEIELIAKHKRQLHKNQANDTLMQRYYQGLQRVEALGMAIPPSMRKFLVIANWPRIVVDTINNRQQVRALILPGEETADPQLREIWDANNLTAHIRMFNADRMIYGRSFMSVGTNEDDPSLPIVRVESPREITAFVDTYTETMTSAVRFYGRNDQNIAPSNCTLMKPNETVWAEMKDGRWSEIARDDHDLGAVPVVMHLNRRMSGGWVGESQMTDTIPPTDSAVRSLTNLQFAQEAHGVPSIWATGVAKGDFVDNEGKPVPQFEAYFDAIKILSSDKAKWGQFEAADLKNFETALNIYRTEAANANGFPASFFGITSANPPTEGSIRAEEARLVRSVEAQNDEVGMTVGWVGALALRFATGEWVKGNRVTTDWFDASTPTISQREDALAKRFAAGTLSREGYWDELGWSEARKAKEREYFKNEALDPIAQQILRDTSASNADVGA